MKRLRRNLVIGHSHMHALTAVAPGDAPFDFVSCMEPKNGEMVEKSLDQYRAYDPSDYGAVIFMLRGSRNIVFGLLNHPKSPFDFFLPERPDLVVSPAARLLPVALVEAALRRMMLPELALLDQLAAMFRPLDLYQIETPPPLPTDYIRQYPAGFAPAMSRFGVSPLPFRYKIWRVHSGIVRAHCQRSGITFIDAPAQAQDQDGSLAEPYRRQDPSHANGGYGRLVLSQILARR